MASEAEAQRFIAAVRWPAGLHCFRCDAPCERSGVQIRCGCGIEFTIFWGTGLARELAIPHATLARHVRQMREHVAYDTRKSETKSDVTARIARGLLHQNPYASWNDILKMPRRPRSAQAPAAPL